MWVNASNSFNRTKCVWRTLDLKVTHFSGTFFPILITCPKFFVRKTFIVRTVYHRAHDCWSRTDMVGKGDSPPSLKLTLGKSPKLFLTPAPVSLLHIVIAKLIRLRLEYHRQMGYFKYFRRKYLLWLFHKLISSGLFYLSICNLFLCCLIVFQTLTRRTRCSSGVNARRKMHCKPNCFLT